MTGNEGEERPTRTPDPMIGVPSLIITCFVGHNNMLPKICDTFPHCPALLLPLTHTYIYTPTHTRLHTRTHARMHAHGLSSSPVGCGMGLAVVATAGLKIAQRTWQGIRLKAELWFHWASAKCSCCTVQEAPSQRAS